MMSFLILIHQIIWLYIYIIIASAVLSWLIVFNVVNTNNRIVLAIADTLNRLTEPVLGPIRRVLPSMGGLDLSPVIVILLLIFIDNLIFEVASSAVTTPAPTTIETPAEPEAR